MKIVEIEIPEETVNLEKSRPPEAMRYDDFVWCVGVVFSFTARALVVDASLFGFMKKLFGALRDIQKTGQPVLLNDMIHLHDTFGNGSASIRLDPLLKETYAEFIRATEELETKIPSFLGNEDYNKIKTEIERNIQALTP